MRNTLINKGAERTRLIMDIHTGAQTKNEKRDWPLLAAAGMLHARWSGSRRTLATTAAVRVLVESEVVVEVVVARVVSIGRRGSRQVRTRWRGSSAATAAVRVLVVVVVAVRIVVASTVGRSSLRVVSLLTHEQRTRSKVGAGGVAPSPPPPPPPAPHASALASSWRA